MPPVTLTPSTASYSQSLVPKTVTTTPTRTAVPGSAGNAWSSAGRATGTASSLLDAYVDFARRWGEGLGAPALPGERAVYASQMDRIGALGRWMAGLDLAGRAMEVAGAEDSYQEGVRQTAGFAGNLLGTYGGAEVGAVVGGTLCGLGGVTAPAIPVCAGVGGAIGGLAGGWLGDEGATALVDNYWTQIDGALQWAGDGISSAAESTWDFASDSAWQAWDMLPDW